ncbi:hypothetical protein BGX23_010611, partial [Mortierella sp. AD031]
MPDTIFKRNGAALTRNEICILIHVHRYLSGEGPAHEHENAESSSSDTPAPKRTPRQLLALVTGVGVSSAQKAIALYKSGQEPREIEKLGRPKLS